MGCNDDTHGSSNQINLDDIDEDFGEVELQIFDTKGKEKGKKKAVKY